MIYKHKPVLLQEVIDYLNVKKGAQYIDATLGGGGYTFEILERGGKVLGIDLDKDAIEHAEELKVESGELRVKSNLILRQGNFRDIDKIAKVIGFEKVDGIVFDLGLSSYQIEQSVRGFSFLKDEPLDMRMEEEMKVTAADIVNHWSREELYELFSKMGEERFASAISDSIIRSRRVKPIKTSFDLVKIVQEEIKEKRKIHPATKVFQALRMAVNEEILNLKSGLEKAFNILVINGRLVVVSFHSLEDRIVKMYFKELEKKESAKIITKRPINANINEISVNPRARSAKLRVIEKMI